MGAFKTFSFALDPLFLPLKEMDKASDNHNNRIPLRGCPILT